MAQIANSFATFNSSRIREQLADKIWNVSPSDQPTLALIGKEKIQSQHPEWLTDAFRAGQSNKVEVGNTSVPSARQDTPRFDNRTQISEDVFSITGSQQASEKAGGNDESALQEAKAMVQLKSDIEFGALQNTTAITAAAGVAPQARGLLGFIRSNTSKGVGGVDPNAATNTAPTDGTARAFTETLLKDVFKLMFDNGAPSMDSKLYALIPSAQRPVFDTMLAGQTRFDKAEDKTLTATLEVYIGPFGRVKVVNARNMRQREIFIINPDYVSLATFRPMKATKLGVRGDAEEYLVNCEWSLKVKNEKALGAIRDLT